MVLTQLCTQGKPPQERQEKPTQQSKPMRALRETSLSLGSHGLAQASRACSDQGSLNFMNPEGLPEALGGFGGN